MSTIQNAWDRPTYYGMADSLDEANQMAKAKLAEWRSVIQQPVTCMRADGLVDLVVMSPRPGKPERIVKAGIKADQIQPFIQAYIKKLSAK